MLFICKSRRLITACWVVSLLLIAFVGKTGGQGQLAPEAATLQQVAEMQGLIQLALSHYEMSELLELIEESDDGRNCEESQRIFKGMLSGDTHEAATSHRELIEQMSEYREKFERLLQKIKNDSLSETIAYNQNLQRNLKFQRPPRQIEVELADDEIDDLWEANSEGREPDFVPVIGIITQPVSASKKENGFNFHDYVLEVNDNFVKWAGSKTIAIPFDVSEQDLTVILDQINGVLLTGGALTLIDPASGELHPYYVTAKRVIEYSKMKKDKHGEVWPVLGICQGLEVVSVYQANDSIDALDTIVIYGENRPINWTGAASNSAFFKDWPKELRDQMEEEGLALHAHTYSTSMATYEGTPGLRDEMIVTQTDIWHDEKNVSGSPSAEVPFIAAMEHKRYPIYTSMYHPEYQLLVFTGDRRWTTVENQATAEIAFRFSLKLNRMARQNRNRISKENEELFRTHMAISRATSQRYPMIDDIAVYAYGFKEHVVSTAASMNPSS